MHGSERKRKDTTGCREASRVIGFRDCFGLSTWLLNAGRPLACINLAMSQSRTLSE